MKLAYTISFVIILILLIAILIWNTWMWNEGVADAATAVNGYISPFIGAVSIALLYKTLMKQIEQNKRQDESLKLEASEKVKSNIIAHLELVKHLLLGFEWVKEDDSVLIGIEAWDFRINENLDEYKMDANKNTASGPEILIEYIIFRLLTINRNITQNKLLDEFNIDFLKNYYFMYYKIHFEYTIDNYMIAILRQDLSKSNNHMNKVLNEISFLRNISSDFVKVIEFARPFENN